MVQFTRSGVLCILITILSQLAKFTTNEVVSSQDVVDQINNDPTSTWKADTYGTDEFDPDDFSKTRLGLKFKPRMGRMKFVVLESLARREHQHKNHTRIILPEFFSWTDSKNTKCPISHIRDQSNCGSCWAVSTAAAFGDRICIQSENKIRVNISSQYITSCDTSNYGCNGGYMDLVHEFLMNGVITGGDFDSDVGCQPYAIPPCSRNLFGSKMPCAYDSAFTPKCRKKTCTNDWYSKKEKTDNTFYAKSYKIINSTTDATVEYNIREDLYENGPLTLGFIVYEDFRFYKSGIYIPRPNQKPLGGHAVRLVGWGEEKGIKYWLIANSWSEKWGENGFFKIIRGTNACQIESEAVSAMPDLKK